jgi:hypothetical protein
LVPYLTDDIDFYAIQKEVKASDRAVLSDSKIHFFGDELENFEHTAALCMHMDLVVSVDTSVAHLAGALGQRTWILLPYVPDWRWMLNRADSPWYPSVELIRQDASRSWVGPLEQMRKKLLGLK